MVIALACVIVHHIPYLETEYTVKAAYVMLVVRLPSSIGIYCHYRDVLPPYVSEACVPGFFGLSTSSLLSRMGSFCRVLRSQNLLRCGKFVLVGEDSRGYSLSQFASTGRLVRVLVSVCFL